MPKDKKKLFDEDDSEEEVSLKTENEYAKKYDVWRGKEEIHKLEQKYGSNVLNKDVLSSDSEDESDEPLEESEEMEKQFLKTLALLKTKDPRIYDPKYEFFENAEVKPEKDATKKEIKFEDSDEESDDDDGNIFKIEKKAAEVAPSSSDGKKERKDSDSKESNLKDFLIGKAEHIDDPVEKDLEPLKALWSNPNLNEGEAFLRDYILNKRYLEEGEASLSEKLRDDEELEVDQATVEEQRQFERAYNFRFEEPDDEYLKRYPRTMSAVRPKDDRRARHRAELRARKEHEKQNKMDEIARLRAAKLKEIHEKIQKIKEVTGNDELAFGEEELDSDFDPAEHDRRMARLFDHHYYGGADDTKPEFPELDQELEIENWEKYENEDVSTYPQTSGDRDGPHCEDDDFNMDAEYDPKQARTNLMEEIKSNLGKKRRNRRKKSKLAALLETEKPKYIPAEDTSYEQFMDEYYKMECEDVIGDLPTRFKYRQVVPNDYGLTVEEILLADDRELTQWAPIKKIVKHRNEAVEKSEVNTYRQKGQDVNLKKKIIPSLFKDIPEEPELVVPVQNESKKKKKKKNKKNNNETVTEEVSQEQRNGDEIKDIVEDSGTTETNGEAESTNKKKRKKNKKRNDSLTFEVEDVQTVAVDNQNNDKQKRKQKNNDTNKNGNGKDDVMPTKSTNVNGFTVEDLDGTPNVGKTKEEQKTNEQNNRIAKKHKLDSSRETTQVPQKKKKHKDFNKNSKNKNFKSKFNNKPDDKSSDPMAKLSDERLKAYGLNPKKYRGFLKYKKY